MPLSFSYSDINETRGRYECSMGCRVIKAVDGDRCECIGMGKYSKKTVVLINNRKEIFVV